MNDWIEVFKTGAHTDSNGNTKTWTTGDLDHIVNMYDPLNHEAPVVIGHPESNSPAWGWVGALKRDGEILFAKPKDLVAEFVEMLRKKMFKKRSISLYPDGSLRHIGFLGATPPAVKGLADIAFNDTDAVTLEFTDVNPERDNPKTGKKDKEVKIMKFFEWLKDLAKEKGIVLDDMPVSFSEKDVQTKITDALEKQKQTLTAEFAEASKRKEDELKTREEKLRVQEMETKKKGIGSFCEGLLKEGKLTPAIMKFGMGMQNFLEQISTIETTIEFGEVADKKKQTPLEFMQGLLSGLGKQIEFKEVATGDKDAGPKGQAAEKLEKITGDKMKADKDLTYSGAFAEAQRENPELAAEYAETIGK